MQIQRTDYISSVGGAITTLTNENFSIMKKKFLITSIAVAAMAIGGGVFVRTALIQSDPILEANVEALASGEGGDWTGCSTSYTVTYCDKIVIGDMTFILKHYKTGDKLDIR